MNKAKNDQEMINKVLQYGKEYFPMKIPPHLVKYQGEPGDCFDTSIKACFFNKKLKYVEGVAFHLLRKEFVLHAWVVEGENAYDLTWKAVRKDTGEEFPVPSVYIGIEMDTKLVADFMAATEYKSVLSNGWRDKQKAERLLGFKI